jgi:hypothetical protein
MSILAHQKRLWFFAGASFAGLGLFTLEVGKQFAALLHRGKLPIARCQSTARDTSVHEVLWLVIYAINLMNWLCVQRDTWQGVAQITSLLPLQPAPIFDQVALPVSCCECRS